LSRAGRRLTANAGFSGGSKFGWLPHRLQNNFGEDFDFGMAAISYRSKASSTERETGSLAAHAHKPQQPFATLRLALDDRTSGGPRRVEFGEFKLHRCR
jgi:hypothetical protein